jgi:hypothetical protein
VAGKSDSDAASTLLDLFIDYLFNKLIGHAANPTPCLRLTDETDEKFNQIIQI